jgi:hypothetical protein
MVPVLSWTEFVVAEGLGVEGAGAGVAVAGEVKGPEPTELWAATWNSYATPSVRPVTVEGEEADDEAVVQEDPESEEYSTV